MSLVQSRMKLDPAVIWQRIQSCWQDSGSKEQVRPHVDPLPAEDATALMAAWQSDQLFWILRWSLSACVQVIVQVPGSSPHMTDRSIICAC